MTSIVSGRSWAALSKALAVALFVAGLAVPDRAVAPLAGCARPPPPQALEEPLRVELSGCEGVRAGPVCEPPPDRALRVWVPRGGAPAPVFASDAGDVVVIDATPVQSGVSFRVRVAREATLLRVERRSGERLERWQLRLAAPADFEALQRAKALRAKGDLGGARGALEQSRAAWSGSDQRARGLGLLARIRLAQGDVEPAAGLLREAIEQDRASERLSGEADDSFALVFVLLERQFRFAEARAVLERIAGRAGAYPEGQARLHYFGGILAMELGDYRAALEHLDEARTRAERLGLDIVVRDGGQAKALVLSALGRHREALALLEQVAARMGAGGSCEAVDVATNQGWIAILSHDAETGQVPAAGDAGAPPDPLPPLERAVALYPSGCEDPHRHANARVNLALAGVQGGRFEEALRQLEHSRRAGKGAGANLLAWQLEIQARVELGMGRATAALRVFDEQLEAARASVSPPAQWRAWIGKAEALEALGRLDAAQRAHEQAEALLDGRSLEVPLGEGRTTFFGEHERGTRAHVRLLLRRARDADAMRLVRRARVRLLAGLQAGLRWSRTTPEQRARWEQTLGDFRREREALDREAGSDWTVPKDELAERLHRRKAREDRARAALDAAVAVLARQGAPDAAAAALREPGDGEVMIAYYPVRGEWIGIGLDAAGASSRVMGAPDIATPPERMPELLAAFDAKLARASQVTFLPYGEARRVDLHALPWRGEPLISRMIVRYALDLPPAGTASATPGRELEGLVVADPSTDLPRSRGEAEAVTRALADRRSGPVRALVGADATAALVSELLARARAFHFAGHGVFGGRDGWDSSLVLAAGGRLGTGDVLALPAVPELAVLSACETARGTDDASPEGLGMAHAFLAAGTAQVVAATRIVTDPVATALATELWRRLPRSGGGGAAEALRGAQLEVRRAHPGGDWGAYRAIVR